MTVYWVWYARHVLFRVMHECEKDRSLIGVTIEFYGNKKIGKPHSGGEYKGVMEGYINEVMPMFNMN